MESHVEKAEKLTYNWNDVTQDFVGAVSELQLGELLHDSSFGLFEAMSAIEMMDPKMDAGMMCNQIRRKVLTLEQAVESNCIKIQDLTMPEQIGIMDSTLACLVTWLEGHSLAQTVFTNLYLHDPYLIEDRCLKAFSICSLKIVDNIREKINRANVFEEEDFQPMSYGFKMAAEVTDARTSGMMKEVEEDVNRLIKMTRSKPGEERDAATEQEHELATAVFSRIRFYRLLHSMLMSFSKEKCEGIPQAQKTLVQLLELVPQVKATIHFGIQPEDREATKNDYPTIMGFEPLINQRLLPPTFPRYTVIKSRTEAMDYVENLLLRLQTVTSVPEMTSLHMILETFIEFSKSGPCVLARSILQQTLLPVNRRIFGIHPVIDFMKDTIRNFIAPPALSQKCSLYNNPQAKEYVDALLTHAVRPVCILFQITGHNRARQRDKWAHVLEDLALLQEEADKVDAFLHGILVKTEPSRNHLACFGTWVLYHTLQAMIYYTLAGFELELYAPYEYHYVYWYLYELLYAWLVSTLHRADNFLLEHETLIDQQQKGRSSKKNKKKKRSKTLSKEIILAQTQQQMCGGYYKAVLGFRLDGKMKQPDFEFDSEEVRYSHRFSPFANVVTPPMVHYGQYKEMSDLRRYEPEPSPEALYTAACKCFHQAKALYESITSPSEEVQTLTKIAKTNFVVMKLLLGGHKKYCMDSPEFDFSLHKVYPIIKLP
ncbi:N-alpha-acetyltransferase 35, NatC auxiliary subunit-like [Haliotis asinina]|uniref:N-alpha-acetyltransferase 35, NatC auxiliary subunit-like n=1 Tax=Haliotis asinina TaxID=109174 RepID=UPI0035321E34